MSTITASSSVNVSASHSNKDQNKKSAHERLYQKPSNRTPVKTQPPPRSSSSRSVSSSPGVGIYERGMQRKMETDRKKQELAASLTPSFSPMRITKNRRSLGTPEPDTNSEAWKRLYQKGKKAHSRTLADDGCTFTPDISKSQRKITSSGSTPKGKGDSAAVFDRLHGHSERLIAKRNTQEHFDKELTFKPVLNKTNENKMGGENTESRVERLYQNGVKKGTNRRSISHNGGSDRLDEGEHVLNKTNENKRGGKNTKSRVERLYQNGVKKGANRRSISHNGGSDRQEEGEYAECTFKPNLKWGKSPNHSVAKIVVQQQQQDDVSEIHMDEIDAYNSHTSGIQPSTLEFSDMKADLPQAPPEDLPQTSPKALETVSPEIETP